MQTLSHYKKLQAEVERAQVKYHRAILALQSETQLYAKRAEQAGKIWRTKPSPANRKKMLSARKAWAERVKLLESLLGRLYAG